jgi:hypothetical protein
MTRDEGELLKFWIKHHSDLSTVRAIVIIDHSSKIPITLSSFVLDNDKSYHLYNFTHNSYLQAHVLNKVAEEIAMKYPQCVVLPLDTDEFLPIKESLSIPKSKLEVGHLDWTLTWPSNLFLRDVGSDGQIDLSQVNFMPRSWGGNKHFLSSKMIGSGYKWSQGAHVVYNKFGVKFSSERVGTIIHVPVQSMEQVFSKFERGDSVHDNQLLNVKDDSGNRIASHHWRIVDDFLTDRDVFLTNALGVYYDSPITTEHTISWEDLISGRNLPSR